MSLMLLTRLLIPGLAASAAAVALLAEAPPASAECSYSGGVTICAQGNVNGPSNVPTSSGPYYPYPCEDDWLCDDGGVSIIVDPSPPIWDVGLPGRPGNRPGRPGRG
jgi:hypothetical protein